MTGADPGHELPPPPVDEDRVRRTVDDVLSQPEYDAAEPSLLQQAWDWLWEYLGRALDAMLGTGEGALIGWLLLGLAVAVVAGLAFRFARGLRRNPEVVGPVAGTVGRRPEEWMAEARTHEQAGRHRDALRCHYRALLAELAAGGLVEEVPGRTTGEYRTEIAAAVPDAAGPVEAVTEVFDSAWYGDAPVTASDLEDFADHAARVRRAAGVHDLAAT